MLTFILLLAMFVLLLLEGLGLPSPPRFHFGWMGLACGALTLVIKFWPG